MAFALAGISWHVFFKEELPIMMRHVAGRRFEQGPARWDTWTAVHFGVGFVVTWFYAAIRPRFGPGAKTAVIAGLAAWLVWALADAWWISLPLGTIGAVFLGSICYLVVFVIAAVAGACLYKECAGRPHGL